MPVGVGGFRSDSAGFGGEIFTEIFPTAVELIRQLRGSLVTGQRWWSDAGLKFVGIHGVSRCVSRVLWWGEFLRREGCCEAVDHVVILASLSELSMYPSQRDVGGLDRRSG